MTEGGHQEGERISLSLPAATPPINFTTALFCIFLASLFLFTLIYAEGAQRVRISTEILGERPPNQFFSSTQLKLVKAAACGRRRVCGGISGQTVRLYQNKELLASFAITQGEQQASSALNKLLPLVKIDQEGFHAASSCSDYRLHQHCER